MVSIIGFMAYEISGTIKVLFETQSFPSGFSKREFVITTEGKFPQDIKLECLKEKADQLDLVREGQKVKVQFDINGREYNGRYFVNLNAWKVEPEGDGGTPAKDSTRKGEPYPEDTTDYSVKDEPF